MSYFRGEKYIWNDSDEKLHIWSDTRDPGSDTTTPLSTPQRIVLSCEMADELAVMRFLEMIEDGRIESAIRRAGQSGNAGKHTRETGVQVLGRIRSMLGMAIKA